MASNEGCLPGQCPYLMQRQRICSVGRHDQRHPWSAACLVNVLVSCSGNEGTKVAGMTNDIQGARLACLVNDLVPCSGNEDTVLASMIDDIQGGLLAWSMSLSRSSALSRMTWRNVSRDSSPVPSLSAFLRNVSTDHRSSEGMTCDDSGACARCSGDVMEVCHTET